MSGVSTPVTAENPAVPAQVGENKYNFALVSLTTLFFMWGFITSLNDILIPYLRNIFSLSYTQAMMVQFCFFFAYFVCSIPSGQLVKQLGYQKGMVIGLLVAACGCLLFFPAASLQSYPVFLGALFVLASGITLLQVAANPYVTVLGSSRTASSRLTLTQAFNSLGTTIAPYLGSAMIFAAAGGAAALAANGADSVKLPYLLLAGMLIILAVCFYLLKLPKIDAQSTEVSAKLDDSAWRHRHLILGAVAIFMYVGAEVAIGSFLINYLGEEKIAGLSEHEASIYVSYYWGGAMIGRFIGSAVMQKIAANKVLTFNGIMSALLLVITMVTDGPIAMWSVVLIGLFNSVMFPTIFSLALQGLGKSTSQGSGILCMAIVGGAFIPLIQGVVADQIGIQLAFFVPILCYVYIIFYGVKGYTPTSVPSKCIPE
ncbi:sugar MFS transporter [Marinibactrum halimedae]|uniref:Glucose/galactose MFS transporter n=1 Tax=Marinibactrum halimedae TaxID=1444977 RepID=A0AA37WKN4_9GAMM|nr:sugar MFS transporter [Marinibactrum halimedae]MCD9459137.1 sugar MFS transporter [Marinibactrum halimedae]GLS24739.1 glucose/galactose MFS transporter [Marinibactrum halimedae]